MNVRKALTVLSASLLATGLFLTAATPAQAAPTETMYTDDSDSGGRVRFAPDGDVTTLCDIEEDGFGAHLTVTDTATGSVRYTYNIGGNGNCIILRASLGAKYDLVEGHIFKFRICLSKAGKYSYCDDAYWLNQN
jgi:hypothetical protein